MKKAIEGKRIKERKHIVVVGATSAIAEHCMRLWITQSPADLVLIARNEKKAKVIASDLKARSPDSVIEVLQTDFLNATAIKNLVNKIAQRKSVDIALIAHGTLPDQKNCEQDLELNQSVLELNAISPVLFAEAFALHMQKSKGGTLALIGSVAGDRGRKSNYVYGAAKGLITRYTQGLQHRFAKTNVNLVILGGGLGDKVLDVAGVEALAKLPSLDEVRGTLVGLIQAPATKIARVLQAPAQQMVNVTKAYGEKG